MNLVERLSKLKPEQRKPLELKLQQQGIDIHQIPITQDYRKDYEYFPLSMEQEPMWVVEKYDPNNPFYEIPGAVMMARSLDIKLLERSTNEVVKRHEILRAVFIIHDDKPVQYILPWLTLPLQRVDFKGLAVGEQERRLKDLREDRGLYAFDLARGPLIKTLLVELGEIENRLRNHGDIREAVVLAKADEGGNNYLCGYIEVEREFEVSELRDYLVEVLPDYMIPSFFIQMEKLPLTPNGKIDRKALPEPDIQHIRPAVEYVGPRNAVEQTLVRLWADVLNMERIGIDDNFFELGGHSLNAAILVSKIRRELDVQVPLAEMSRVPTIRGLAGYIAGAPESPFVSIPAMEKKDYYALSSAQERFYILQQMDLDSTTYNMPYINVLGLLLETLAVRNYPQETKTFEQFPEDVKQNALKAFENQAYPFGELIKHVWDENDRSRNPLFDAMLNVLNIENMDTPREERRTGDLRLMPYEYDTHDVSKVDLTLTAFEREDKIFFTLEYCTKLFNRETMERFVNSFKSIMSTVVENKTVKLADIQISHDLVTAASNVFRAVESEFDF
jgi:acyl carrier protein